MQLDEGGIVAIAMITVCFTEFESVLPGGIHSEAVGIRGKMVHL